MVQKPSKNCCAAAAYCIGQSEETKGKERSSCENSTVCLERIHGKEEVCWEKRGLYSYSSIYQRSYSAWAVFAPSKLDCANSENLQSIDDREKRERTLSSSEEVRDRATVVIQRQTRSKTREADSRGYHDSKPRASVGNPLKIPVTETCSYQDTG